jgi:hypothetical protein
MFKTIFLSFSKFVENTGLFQKSANKDETNIIKYAAIKDLDEHIIDNEPAKIIEGEQAKVEEEHIKQPEEIIEKVENQTTVEQFVKGQTTVEQFVKDQTTVEQFVKGQEYDSDDEVIIHKQIYRIFTVKAPYNGPSQIVLSDNEQLVKVYENGQYVATRLNIIEDYGTDDEEEHLKVIYNIVVES